MKQESHTATIEQALFEMKKVIVGQEQLLERMLVSVLSRGHLLLEGVPGLAKTLAVKTVAQVLGGTFARIQFTPDLVPADLMGSRVWHPDTGHFEVEPGPVFANFVLADEINRAPAKVQSALLEVMEEKQVTIARETLHVDPPFFVLATQNPIESEGVYPLPEAQSDRFLLKVTVGYPTASEEAEIVRRMSVESPSVQEVVGPAGLLALAKAADAIYVDPAVTQYAVSLVGATRPGPNSVLRELGDAVEFGGSPRASLSLIRAARALALLRGRDYALPQDVGELAYDALRHRLVLSYQAIVDGVVPEHVIQRALQTVPMPAIDLSGGQARTDTHSYSGPYDEGYGYGAASTPGATASYGVYGTSGALNAAAVAQASPALQTHLTTQTPTETPLPGWDPGAHLTEQELPAIESSPAIESYEDDGQAAS